MKTAVSASGYGCGSAAVKLVFGMLESQPLNDYDGQVGLGQNWLSALSRFGST
jgi:hypothetical protein